MCCLLGLACYRTDAMYAHQFRDEDVSKRQYMLCMYTHTHTHTHTVSY